jgi:oligopeptide transport system substrate-binding protein
VAAEGCYSVGQIRRENNGKSCERTPQGWHVANGSPSPPTRRLAVAAGNRTQTLHVNNSAEPRDLDPHTTTIPADINVIRAIMEGLCEVDPITCLPIPGVATTWSVSADGLTWTFHLRPNARWSNNDPVTARDFVYAYRRILAPDLGAEFRDQFYILKNAEAFATGKLTDFSQVGVSAPDDQTLILLLVQPVPYLPTLVTQICWYPLHRATIEKYGRIDERLDSPVGRFVLKP